MKRIAVSLIWSCSLLYGCQKVDIENVTETIADTDKELQQVWVGEQSICDTLVLAPWEWRDVLASDADTITIAEPWRRMTRIEAVSIHNHLSADDCSQRLLCWDESEWYTFRWGGGSVTKAGEKTLYRLRLVRTATKADSISISL